MDDDIILEMLQNTRRRPAYLIQILEFQLGRKPTQEEIDIVNSDNELRRNAHKLWLEQQPWHLKKHHVGREERIKRVMIKRYNMPESLINAYSSEIEDHYC